MPSVVDARGRSVTLTSPPRRIVSLVPSTTETLFDLGIGHAVVGVTRFCVHPERARSLPKVGGTKDVMTERVAALKPDLIVGNCEENTREIFEALEPVAPVYAAFPRTVPEALDDLERLGRLTCTPHAAAVHAVAMRKAHDDLLALEPPPMRVAYLIWREPWMAIGEDTFIADMLFQARLSLVDLGAGRFPTFEPEALGAADPDLVLLSSEPFPFKRKHADELAERSGLPRDRFVGVDGELVSWHGTRVRAGLEALGQWRVGHFPVLPT